MATYLEQLTSEPERLRRGILGVVEDQEAMVRRLQALFEEYQAQLDQQVLRFLMLRQLFGGGHGETAEAERRTEDASKPVTELRQVLQRQRQILATYREHLEEYARTGALASLGTGDVPSAERAAE